MPAIAHSDIKIGIFIIDMKGFINEKSLTLIVIT